MTLLQERLFAMQDKQYAAFQAKLTPGVPVESFIGIRVPVLRKFAKEFTKEAECEDFLHQLPHEYYDENMLHGLLISEVKDYEECIRLTEKFLPFVDNWAVCDIMSPKVFTKHKKELLAKIKTWSKSSHVYTCRFGIGALMSHYLDKDFKAEYLEIPASVRSEEYYVKMMVAWFFATALAKQWEIGRASCRERVYFLPFVDNWAVCDIMSPKVFAKHKKELLAKITAWSKSLHVYTCRFGIEILMSYYLDKDFKAEYLEIPASVRSEEYYVKMMVAWFFATALAKQWDQAIPYIEQNRLAPWTHNKTIQKAIESYRITPEQKEYLRTLKIK